MEGLSKKETSGTQDWCLWGLGEVEEEGKGEVSGDGWRLSVVNTVQCTDDVLWNCASETCIILLNSVTPINSIKREKYILVM